MSGSRSLLLLPEHGHTPRWLVHKTDRVVLVVAGALVSVDTDGGYGLFESAELVTLIRTMPSRLHWVPLDHLYASVDEAEHRAAALALGLDE